MSESLGQFTSHLPFLVIRMQVAMRCEFEHIWNKRAPSEVDLYSHGARYIGGVASPLRIRVGD